MTDSTGFRKDELEAVQRVFGKQLRSIFDTVSSEPLPPAIQVLMQRLELDNAKSIAR